MNLGTTITPGLTTAARRATAPGWRDPRLWVGVAIVAVSVLVGALALGTSDDTVAVWAAGDTMGTGHVLTGDDLTVRRVHFADDADSALYLPADRRLPAGLRLLRPVGAGELLPRAAVGPTGADDVREVPVSVPPDQVPGSVGAGDTVDVYLRPGSRAGCDGTSVCSGRPVLAGVTVLDAPPVSDAFGADGSRMLVLGMDEPEAQRFFRLLAATDEATLTVVGRG
ncbi:MAG TPA: hypothetical protein VFJ89_01385 [Nocardioides sp.]|nr:hypothetical protein [Nocardioides sp.]